MFENTVVCQKLGCGQQSVKEKQPFHTHFVLWQK